ncbi:MAG: HTTM domain-containing protein [Myxococcota bacterium]
MRRLADWLFWSEGSTRSVALLRVALVLLCWSRWGGDLLLYKASDAAELAISVSFYASTALLLAGFLTPLAGAWTAATLVAIFAFLGVVRGVEAYVHHHVFLLVAASVLLALTPCGRSLSVDRWLALRRSRADGHPPPPERGPLHGQRLLAMLVSSVYLFATWDKLTPGFLSGERLQHVLLDRYGTSAPPSIPGFETLCLLGALGTVAMEATLGIGLWVPRIQRPLLVAGALFHGMLFVVLPVGPFSATMVALYLAFLDPAAVHRAVGRLLGDAPPPAAADDNAMSA